MRSMEMSAKTVEAAVQAACAQPGRRLLCIELQNFRNDLLAVGVGQAVWSIGRQRPPGIAAPMRTARRTEPV